LGETDPHQVTKERRMFTAETASRPNTLLLTGSDSWGNFRLHSQDWPVQNAKSISINLPLHSTSEKMWRQFKFVVNNKNRKTKENYEIFTIKPR